VDTCAQAGDHPPNVQGRVFSTLKMAQVASQPVGYLLSGLLAGRLGPALGWLVGSGPGYGMAAMFLCASLLGSLVGMLGLLSRSLRDLEGKNLTRNM
jgi:hypothetical protein